MDFSEIKHQLALGRILYSILSLPGVCRNSWTAITIIQWIRNIYWQKLAYAVSMLCQSQCFTRTRDWNLHLTIGSDSSCLAGDYKTDENYYNFLILIWSENYGYFIMLFELYWIMIRISLLNSTEFISIKKKRFKCICFLGCWRTSVLSSWESV